MHGPIHSITCLFFYGALLFAGPFVHAQETADHPSADRVVTLPSGAVIHAEVVQTPAARQKGLMFRDHLPKSAGMLFLFPRPASYQFWMKNCKFPLDMIWLNEKKEVVHLVEKAPPCSADPCPQYGPTDRVALYVLEINAGLARKERLKLGSRLHF